MRLICWSLTISPLTSQAIWACGRLWPNVQFQRSRSPVLASSTGGSWISVKASFWTSISGCQAASFYLKIITVIETNRKITDNGEIGFGGIRMKSAFGWNFTLVRPFGFCCDTSENDSARFESIGLDSINQITHTHTQKRNISHLFNIQRTTD